MKQYEVSGSFRGSFCYTVIASTEDEARELAQGMIDESDIDDINPIEITEEL